MPLARIRLELGRIDGFPNGSSSHGYEFVAPLTPESHIDTTVWEGRKKECWVRRFWGKEPDEFGLLNRHGSHGWYFDYQKYETSDDEPFFKLDRHALVKDSYVSVTEHDGVRRPFKVVEVETVSTAA